MDPELQQSTEQEPDLLSEELVPGNLLGDPVKGAPDLPPDESIRGGGLEQNRFSRPLNALRHQLTLFVLLAITGLGALLIVLVAVFQQPETQAAIREIGTLVFPPLVTLAGTSFAWFFATKDREPKE